MLGRFFYHTIRVPYANVDQMGFVYYANYLIYFEMARSEMLREVGMPYGELEQRGIMLPVVHVSCEYRKPAHFDDLLTVRSNCSMIRGARLHIDYEIKKTEDGAMVSSVGWKSAPLLVSGCTEHICMSPDGKVLRPLADLKRLMDVRMGQEPEKNGRLSDG